MLCTAPPETIEQAHAEAFAQLTPAQRHAVLKQMGDSVPPAERAAVEQNGASPQALARAATRAEMRQPSSMSMGGMMAGGLLSTIAGAVIGSMIARILLGQRGSGVGRRRQLRRWERGHRRRLRRLVCTMRFRLLLRTSG